MSRRENISMSVIRRMPRYHRYLTDLLASGTYRISSRELARKMGLTASQIRQDLNCFGGFGQQGYGYDVEKLHSEIGKIIGADNNYPAVLIGCGNLGRAVAIHLLNNQTGFELVAAFDNSPILIGANMRGLPVLHSENLIEYCYENHPIAAFLCLPTEHAEETVQQLYSCGVRYFWNFTHYDITLNYPDAVVENVHLTDSLMTLCYCITDGLEAETDESEGSQD